MPQLSFWSELQGVLKECGDSGEFPFEHALKVDLDKLEPGDRQKVSKCINSPAEAVESQLCLLLHRYGLTAKLEVVRHKNRLYIAPVSL